MDRGWTKAVPLLGASLLARRPLARRKSTGGVATPHLPRGGAGRRPLKPEEAWGTVLKA